MERDSNQPTLSSLWEAAAGLPVTDELLAWPADLFALTDIILCRSEAYRLCLAPPQGQVWPPGRFPSWPAAVEQAAQQWILRLEDGRAALPDLVLEQWRLLRARSELPIELLAEGSDWPLCEALLTLHAVSDEARPSRRGARQVRRARVRLSRAGPRATGEDGFSCSDPDSPRPGAAQGSNAHQGEFAAVLCALRLRPRAERRGPLAQGAGAAHRQRTSLRARQHAALALAVARARVRFRARGGLGASFHGAFWLLSVRARRGAGPGPRRRNDSRRPARSRQRRCRRPARERPRRERDRRPRLFSSKMASPC
jgi:hypothetical protein